MMVVRYSNEVLKPLIIYQKFDIRGTYVPTFVEDKRPDLLDFLPEIKGVFLTIGLQNNHHSCRLAYSKCLWTSVFLHMAGKILIYVLMFIYDSKKSTLCCSYIKHFRWFICVFLQL
jgi:hypothetical protein